MKTSGTPRRVFNDALTEGYMNRPMWSTLPSVVNGTGFADDGDLDLARILQRLLDLLAHVASESTGGKVVDLVWRDQDADFSSGLDRKGFLDPLEGVRNAFERLEPLDVSFDHFTARAGPGTADCVGSGHDEGLDRLWLLFAVVRGDGVDNLGRAAEPAGDICADQGVRAFDFVVDCLADVVEQPRCLADVDVRADLGGQGAGDDRGFQRVGQDVLPVAGAEFEPAKQLDQVRMQANDIRLIGDALALFADRAIQLGLRLVDNVLDPGRVDPAVLKQLLQHAPRQLATEWVVRRCGDDL